MLLEETFRKATFLLVLAMNLLSKCRRWVCVMIHDYLWRHPRNHDSYSFDLSRKSSTYLTQWWYTITERLNNQGDLFNTVSLDSFDLYLHYVSPRIFLRQIMFGSSKGNLPFFQPSHGEGCVPAWVLWILWQIRNNHMSSIQNKNPISIRQCLIVSICR